MRCLRLSRRLQHLREGRMPTGSAQVPERRALATSAYASPTLRPVVDSARKAILSKPSHAKPTLAARKRTNSRAGRRKAGGQETNAARLAP